MGKLKTVLLTYWYFWIAAIAIGFVSIFFSMGSESREIFTADSLDFNFRFVESVTHGFESSRFSHRLYARRKSDGKIFEAKVELAQNLNLPAGKGTNGLQSLSGNAQVENGGETSLSRIVNIIFDSNDVNQASYEEIFRAIRQSLPDFADRVIRYKSEAQEFFTDWSTLAIEGAAIFNAPNSSLETRFACTPELSLIVRDDGRIWFEEKGGGQLSSTSVGKINLNEGRGEYNADAIGKIPPTFRNAAEFASTCKNPAGTSLISYYDLRPAKPKRK